MQQKEIFGIIDVLHVCAGHPQSMLCLLSVCSLFVVVFMRYARSYCLLSCGGRIIIVEVNTFENGSLRSTGGVYDD